MLKSEALRVNYSNAMKQAFKDRMHNRYLLDELKKLNPEHPALKSRDTLDLLATKDEVIFDEKETPDFTKFTKRK
jgi:hypothetical protein